VSDTRADEPNIIEHLSVDRKLRLVPSPKVNRPRSAPESRMKGLLDGLSRRRAGKSEVDAPDAA
jgi:hypothetical protein